MFVCSKERMSGRASIVKVEARGCFITACAQATIWSVFIPTPSFEVCEMVARQQLSETTSSV